MADPKAVFVNFVDSPFEREAQEVADNIPQGFAVVRVPDMLAAQEEVDRCEAVLICHEADKESCYRICREKAYDASFRAMMFAKNPAKEEAYYFDLKRLVVVCKSPKFLCDELENYTGGIIKSKSLRSIRVRLSKPSKEYMMSIPDYSCKRYAYLRKGDGRLVWNMEENLEISRVKE